jgi:protein-disulfide isomerase
MSKRFWMIIGVIVVIFAGIMWLSGNKDKTNGSSTTTQPTSHLRGDTKSKVTLVEYGDFQCPVCGAFYPLVEQTYGKYKDVVRFQFVNYPLIQIHENSVSASRAAEAASNQGKFWEMYALLFQNQKTWEHSTTVSSIFESFASQLQLDVAKFKKDYVSAETNARINADKSAFNKTGMRAATPTFTLNGKQIKPSGSLQDFSKLIDEELKKQGIAVPKDATPTSTPTPAPAAQQ